MWHWRRKLTLLACLTAGLSGCASFDPTTTPTTVASDVARPAAPDNPQVAPVAVAPIERARELVALPLARNKAPDQVRQGQTRSLNLAASVPPPPPSPARGRPAPVADKTEDFDVVPVFWGTDRKVPYGSARPALISQLKQPAPAPGTTGSIVTGSIDKGGLPGAERGDRLIVGRSMVTVPRVAREKGAILRPRQYALLNITFYSEDEDPRRHFTVGSFEPLDPLTFARLGNEHLAKASRNPGQAFIFVHGYNTSFPDALYRTAQLAYDLEFDGVPYLYSWPSKAEIGGYEYDGDSADRARRYFLDFLKLVARDTRATRIHLIAHSLGTRPLLEALKSAGPPAAIAKRLRIDQLILAAPDIDRDLFVEIARSIKGVSRGTTLYAANNDKALLASRKLHGDIPRAGDVPPPGPIVVAGIDTIDISAAGTDSFLSLNHNTYVEGGHVLADVRALLREGVRPPDKRFPAYRAMPSASGTWWRYVKN